MMLDYQESGWSGWSAWHRNGNGNTLRQMGALDATERDGLLAYLRCRPLYKTVRVGDRRYFLSHAGLDPTRPLSKQLPDALTWSRHEFYGYKALNTHICVFGHTPTFYLRSSNDCSVWTDTEHSDKICIDSGCVFGGALAALRLDDGEVFYAKSTTGSRRGILHYDAAPIPQSFWDSAPKIHN